MVSLDDLKEFTLYKKQFYLPIISKDKKHGSAIILLTPNFASSKLAMTAPYVVNHRYFESYYVEKAITKFIKNESVYSSIDYGEYLFEAKLDTQSRNDLPDSEFGIPKYRKYPLNDKEHVLLAIRFFNHVEPKFEKELAENIIKKIKQYDMASEVRVGSKNRFLSYWKNSGLMTIDESCIIDEASRKEVVEIAKKALEDKGLKAHISKNGDWGYTNFVDKETSDTICLGSFNKDIYNTAYDTLKAVIPDDFKVTKDSHFTIFIDDKSSSLKESYFSKDHINKSSLNRIKQKFTSHGSSISFEGFEKDINSAKKYIKIETIEKAFDRVEQVIPKQITIVVCDDYNTPSEFEKDRFMVYTPAAITASGIDISYQDYIIYTIYLYAVYSLAPNIYTKKIYDSIAEPAAIYFSGIAKDKLNSDKYYWFGVENIYKFIEAKYGFATLLNVISSNNVSALMKYNKERNATLDNKFKMPKLLKEDFEFIQEEDDNTNSSAAVSIPSIDDPVPESIKRIQNMATRLKRSIRRQSVYKLNKIRRDMERGNVGVDSRMSTSLQDLQTGLDLSQNNDGSTVEQESMRLSKFNALTGSDYLIEGDTVYLFEDSAKYDPILRKILINDRLKNNKDVLKIYNRVKSEIPDIKFTYFDQARYGGRNLFIDLSYYNEVFFRNAPHLNDEIGATNNIRTFNIYMELLERLLKDDIHYAYKKKTIFIPVLDWIHNNSTRMWMYKEDINPISAIYHLMKTNMPYLKKVFGDRDIVFMGAKNYFKVNFTNSETLRKFNPEIFVRLIRRIVMLGYNSPADPDPTGEFDTSPKGIAMDLIHKVEKSQNVEIQDVSKIDSLSEKPDLFEPTSGAFASFSPAIEKKVSDKADGSVSLVKTGNISVKKVNTNNVARTHNVTVPVITQVKNVTNADNKASIGVDGSKSVNTPSADDKKNAVVDRIVKASMNSDSVDSAVKKLSDTEFVEMIENLKNESPDNTRVDKTQASSVIQSQNEFHNKTVDGRTVQNMLDSSSTPDQLAPMRVEVSSINDDWNNLTFANFDKDYDFNSDIMKMLDSMQYWTYPIAVQNVDIRDNSTSEDIVDLWTIDCIDYKKHKFSIRLDVPKFINGSNFLKLRGNEKTLMIQSTLLPIIKTGLDECQIIGSGGYNKIFVIKYGGRSGQSMPATSRLFRAISKYTKSHDDLKVEAGDNTKICAKYDLPNDYIDLAGNFNSLETNKAKIYFNQDALRTEYEVDDTKGVPIGVETVYDPTSKKYTKAIIYYNSECFGYAPCIASYIAIKLGEDSEFGAFYMKTPHNNTSKSTYSDARILNKKIPIVLICCYLEGLITTLNKAGIKYEFYKELDRTIRYSDSQDYIEFMDGYLVYNVTYSSSMLMNGLKECNTAGYSINDINNRKMYIDFFDKFADNLKTDGIENSYDCMLDPITKEILAKYNMPTDYVSVLIYASNLLCDNKYVKHIDQVGRRWRRKELIAGYFYKALTSGYEQYANSNRRTRKNAKIDIKQSQIIDYIVSGDPATADLSVNNVINDVECTNTVTNKGLVGLNVARGYTISTRGYDDSMLNLLGMDTGFSGNVGINRQATINANVEGGRGFVKSINGDTSKLSTANSFTITESLTPLGSTHDDPQRTLMTYVQTSKHMIRCENNDPTLITTGADEAMPYLVSDIFSYKAKKDGKIIELVEEGFGGKNYMIIEYNDGAHEFVNLSEEVKKNSDGGYFVPMKLDTDHKVGDTFKRNDVLAYDRLSFSKSLGESGNLSANIGTLAKVAIINTDEGFEDSAAITESFANKIGTSVIQGIETNVRKGSNIFIYKNIGDHVIEGDTLFAYQEDFDDDVVNTLLKSLSMNTDEISDLGRNPVKSKYTGIISDIVIYRTCSDEDMSPSLRSFVHKYENKVKDIKKVYDKYGIDSATLPRIGKIPEIGKTKHLDDAVMIIYYIKYNDNMSVGDKIVFYSANKGIIKYIIPKDKEPYTDFRPDEHIDSFMSLSSISGRMTCSIPLFAAASKLMVELDRSVKDLAGIPYDESKL